MERIVKGDIVVIPFPFSDFTDFKKRPAYVAAALESEDLILCQITSRYHSDKYSVGLSDEDFLMGSIKQKSFIRPNHIITTSKKIILYKIGSIKKNKIEEVTDIIFKIFE